MNKDLVFDVIERLQLGGYDDQMVLYRFENKKVTDAFGPEYRLNYEEGAVLDGRFIALYCGNISELGEALDYLKDYLGDALGFGDFSIVDSRFSHSRILLFHV